MRIFGLREDNLAHVLASNAHFSTHIWRLRGHFSTLFGLKGGNLECVLVPEYAFFWLTTYHFIKILASREDNLTSALHLNGKRVV